jgi:hypothetical protein
LPFVLPPPPGSRDAGPFVIFVTFVVNPDQRSSPFLRPSVSPCELDQRFSQRASALM